jgi:hypothetical protein
MAAWSAAGPRSSAHCSSASPGVLAVLPEVKLSAHPRMADFERLGEALTRVDGAKSGELYR